MLSARQLLKMNQKGPHSIKETPDDALSSEFDSSDSSIHDSDDEKKSLVTEVHESEESGETQLQWDIHALTRQSIDPLESTRPSDNKQNQQKVALPIPLGSLNEKERKKVRVIPFLSNFDEFRHFMLFPIVIRRFRKLGQSYPSFLKNKELWKQSMRIPW